MYATVRLRLPSGHTALASPGDLLGRLWSAAVRIDDPRLSEAHALISLRGARLKLLALRGVMAVGGIRVTEVVLEPGVVIELAQGLAVTVEEVSLPDHALALAGLSPEPEVLAASVYSLLEGPQLVPRYVAGALGYICSTGAGFTLQLLGGDPVPLEPDARFQLSGAELAVVRVEGALAGLPETRMAGRLFPPVRLVARYDSVQVHREGMPLAVLTGGVARLLSELGSMGGLASWEAIAGELWHGETDRVLLRQRWDRTLQTLRAKLRELELRPDLIRADGQGHLELLLLPGDEWVDDT
jgi:hypothetical protein